MTGSAQLLHPWDSPVAHCCAVFALYMCLCSCDRSLRTLLAAGAFLPDHALGGWYLQGQNTRLCW